MAGAGVRPLKNGENQSAAVEHRQSNVIGAGLMVLSMLSFVCLDTVMKSLVTQYDIWALAWARSLAQLSYLVALLPFLGIGRVLAVKRPGLQFLRGICLAGMTMAVLLSLANMTLTQTYVAMLSAPLLSAALAGPLLAEPATLRQWFWIVAGFVGVVIALDPATPEIGWFLFYAAAMAVCFGTLHVLTRLGARVELPMTQLLYISLFALILLTIPMLLVAEALPVETWGWVALAGAFGTLAHFLLTKAFSFAPPAVVSPMIYTQVVWAAIAGYLFFTEIPTIGTIIGAVIVALCGIAIVRTSSR